jgi:hypothetical protein
MRYFEENIVFLKSVFKNGVRMQYACGNKLKRANNPGCIHGTPHSKHVAT